MNKPKGTTRAAPRQVRDTERAFIDAATTLFAQKGYKGTSITDLAEVLGLTPASLYYHVSGKQELLLRVLDSGLSDFSQRLEEIANSTLDDTEKLRRAVRNHLDFVLGNPRAVGVFLRERRFLEPPYREQYQERVDHYDALFATIIQSGIDNGDFPAVDARLARLAILGMINWAVEWYMPEGRLSRDDVADGILHLIFHGILTQPASKRPGSDEVTIRAPRGDSSGDNG